MKFQVYSDLHAEFGHDFVPEWDGKSDYLLLAGDIHLGVKPVEYVTYLKACVAQGWKKVFFIAGNHEFYHGNVTTILDDMEDFADASGAIFLNDYGYLLDKKVWLFGGTMWSDLSDPVAANMAGIQMNDYQLCTIGDVKVRKRFTPVHSTAMHFEFAYQLSNFLDRNEKELPVVVMTHMAPHDKSGAKEYKGSALNAAYSTDMTHLMEQGVHTWVHGHMHNASDYMVGDTHILANPYGYHGKGYDQEYMGFKENGIGFEV